MCVVSMCMYTTFCMCVGTHVCGDTKLTLGVLLSCSPEAKSLPKAKDQQFWLV